MGGHRPGDGGVARAACGGGSILPARPAVGGDRAEDVACRDGDYFSLVPMALRAPVAGVAAGWNLLWLACGKELLGAVAVSRRGRHILRPAPIARRILFSAQRVRIIY